MSYTVKDVLRLEVAPALGCTEPVAVALCAAAAVSLLPGTSFDSLDVWVDPNIYKNGLAVSIPGTGGLSGLDTAAALGAAGGDPALRLEVLSTLTDESLERAKELLRSGAVRVHLLADRRGLHVRAEARADGHVAQAVIEEHHDQIVSLTLDGAPVADSPLCRRGDAGKAGVGALESWLKGLPLDKLVELVDELDDEDLAFLEDGVRHNMALADYGLKHGPGLGVGKTFERLVRQKLMRKDMFVAARMLTSAAADARMDGVRLPAMSSAGSGNHGLTAILPIWAVKDYVECDRRTALSAIGLSHIITAYVKAHTGRLSAVCGCSVAAGAGAAAGVAFLLGGDVHHVAGAIKNLMEDLAGVICDGAKAGCALKLATAAGTAVQAALFSLHGVKVKPTDGIIAESPEQTMRNVGALSTEGMIETDRTILNIMLEKKITGLAY
ncbi:serine dehydratase subunit alpha family protein [Fundidesulfovibrio terrae]|uniref:L-cysteine desulfidase family protein n=1 Tax=Fundidesulfovibrio terrae TaxID=2922866 RepID=UPI001FAF2FF5|nr:L-serine ammonia-lyase, iron-sulfur-dependent, subunit alpha [Fundidesulfovibrio terrae]